MANLTDKSTFLVDSIEFLKPMDSIRKSTNSIPTIISSQSCENLSQPFVKHSTSIASRDDSVTSKTSLSSLLPSFMRSFDGSSTFSINQSFLPRPEKTLALFDTVITTLKHLYQRYSVLTHGAESPEEGEMCSKVDKRIMLLQSLKNEYESMIEEKEVELNEIKLSVTSSMASSQNSKEDLDMADCENYWAICREMCIVESKLERCSGKLQFQIIELDSVTRVNPLDQYELSIRLNDTSKFKTRIKIEKNGKQIWDNTTFVLVPNVDDLVDVKFVELKTLNKSMILLERKVPFVNKLILADTSIYTLWLTPVGTVKLRIIVQWNAVLDDPDLNHSLSQIDNKYYETAIKDNITIRKRANTSFTKQPNNRSSLLFSGIFRSDAFERFSARGNMNYITEQADEDIKQDVNIRKVPIARDYSRTKAEYLEDFVVENNSLEGTISKIIITDVSTAKTIEIDTNSDNEALTDEEDIVSVSCISSKMNDVNLVGYIENKEEHFSVDSRKITSINNNIVIEKEQSKDTEIDIFDQDNSKKEEKFVCTTQEPNDNLTIIDVKPWMIMTSNVLCVDHKIVADDGCNEIMKVTSQEEGYMDVNDVLFFERKIGVDDGFKENMKVTSQEEECKNVNDTLCVERKIGFGEGFKENMKGTSQEEEYKDVLCVDEGFKENMKGTSQEEEYKDVLCVDEEFKENMKVTSQEEECRDVNDVLSALKDKSVVPEVDILEVVLTNDELPHYTQSNITITNGNLDIDLVTHVTAHDVLIASIYPSPASEEVSHSMIEQVQPEVLSRKDLDNDHT